MQRLSVAVQRGNAASVMGTMDSQTLSLETLELWINTLFIVVWITPGLYMYTYTISNSIKKLIIIIIIPHIKATN